MLTVADVMTKEVITIAPETPVEAVAKLLYERQISGLPVIDGKGRVVGILSEGDLMAHTAATGSDKPRSWWLRFFSDTGSRAEEYLKTHGRTAADVMSRSPMTIGPDASLAEVAQLLEKNRIKRLPVVDGGKLVGLVSRANLIRGLATAQPPASTTAASDREIKEKLEKAIEAEGLGRLINPIVQDGEVHLWGLVDTDTERRAIVVLTEGIPGVKAVENHLGIQPVWAG
jgi:CBS domain-containing protein